MRFAYILAFFTMIWPSAALASSVHHVAPPRSQLSGVPDGSLERPWRSIADLLRRGSVNGGDSVLLLDGDYGEVTPVGDENPWRHAEILFTARDAVTTLEFAVRSADGGDSTLLLDNVAVSGAPNVITVQNKLDTSSRVSRNNVVGY